MITMSTNPGKQKGVALLTVLLLIATLSFIVLSISERTAIAARRAINANAQSELLWRSFGAEALASAALETAASGGDGEIAPDNPILLAPIDISVARGTGRIQFSDRTNCFNLNSLVSKSGGGDYIPNQEAAGEFISLADSIGLGASEAQRIAAVITDWIDSDSLQELRGAEDGFYTGLPTPFRSGGTLLADVSELRAMNGVSAEVFRQLRPFVCAQPEAAPVPININRTRPRDAPLLVGLLGGRVNTRQAEELISQRPPDGFSDVAEFWQLVEGSGFTKTPEITARISISSKYLEAKVEMTLESSTSEMLIVFSKVDDDVKIVSRRLGPEL